MRVKIKKCPQKKATNGLAIENNDYEMLSPLTLEIKGEKHSNGGTDIMYNNTLVEAEKGEPLSIDSNGNAVIFGNLQVPGTKKKFKNVAKDIANIEKKAFDELDKGISLVNNSDPYNSYSNLSFNSGNVLADAALQKSNLAISTKEMLGNLQNIELEKKNKTNNTKAKNGYSLPKAKDGLNIKNPNDRDYIVASLRTEAMKQGVDPNVIERLAFQESGFNPSAKSNKGALGVMQFMPSTAKLYGIDENQLTSNKPEDVDKVIAAGISHFKSLQDAYGGDLKLALAAYSGGPRAVEFVKSQLGKKNITGDEWMSFMEDRRKTTPTKKSSAWQNQTYDYINNITNTSDSDFFNKKGPTFRTNYYEGIETPDFSNRESGDLNNATKSLPKEEPRNIKGISSLFQPSGPEIHPNALNTNGEDVNNNINNNSNLNLLRNKLGINDFFGELAALTDRPDYVEGQYYNPQPFVPYQVSFQDRLNQNNQTFSSISRQLNNNPEALSILAAQKYNADNSVLGDEFRTNQGITNQITNQNVNLYNQAELQNLQLRASQQQEQDAARAITNDRKQQALTSISNKVAQNKAYNNQMALYENFSNFRPDENLQLQFQGPDAYFNFHGTDPTPQTNKYASTQTVKDSKGNLRYTRINDPSEVQKQMQDYKLFKLFQQFNQ